MKNANLSKALFWLTLILLLLQGIQNTFASHAQSADITYTCLGNNQYQINVSFYRDCSGVNAPNSINITSNSPSCGQNFSSTLNQIAGTGTDVTPICSSLNTVCNGGSYPGVEEYIYQGIITLPAQCTDWTFSFSLCCRNNAINTINNPGNENIYVEAQLNNLDFLCNNSPSFSNPPVSYPCVGQTSCFNHGAIDVDGDSLYYSLQAPATGANTSVTYIAGYSAQQPLIGSIPTTFDPLTGDICMTPSQQEITVLAVKVEEWRNGVFVGSVVRDIQLRTVTCNNNLPYTTGINGTGQFSITACAGSNLNFDILSNDIDAGQTLNLNWNNAINGATFTDNGAQHPTATFNWTPTLADISSTPYCFTVTVTDDNCPLNGVQIFSYCITVSGFGVTSSSTPANCGASNGSASVTTQGGNSPFTYQWIPNGGNNPTANGLSAGQYTVVVVDSSGCSSSSSVVVGSGSQPGNINISPTDVSCYGDSNGTATVNVNGGQPPYSFLWSNGQTQQTATNLSAGLYYVTVTTNNGCIKTDSVLINQPQSALFATITSTDINCFSGNNGTATVNPSGGTSPYFISWNTIPIQNNLTATGLSAGIYTATLTDSNGCTTSQPLAINITQPQPLSITLSNQQNVKCFGGNDGFLSVNVSGGSSPYTYNWNNNTLPNLATQNNLSAGLYLLNVVDNNGCNLTSQYTITQPQVLNAIITNKQDMSCNSIDDGFIESSATGGTPPYSYYWTPCNCTIPNMYGLSAGNYNLKVTDINQCFDTISSIIQEPTLITTLIQSGSLICPGDTADLLATATGGNGVFTFYWSNGFFGNNQQVYPISATNYSVIAFDTNGCTSNIDSTTVLVNDINLANLAVSSSSTICNGDSAVISASISGGLGTYSINWDNGIGFGNGPFTVTPNITTNYLVTIHDNCGNSLNDNIIINVNELPSIQLTSQTASDCGEVQLNISNNISNNSNTAYLWNFGDNTTSSLKTPIKTYTESGIYQVTLLATSPEGCDNTGIAFMDVTVNPIPVAHFDYNPTEIDMLNPEVYFSNNTTDADTYLWEFGDGETSINIDPSHIYAEKGTYTVTLFSSNVYGCNNSFSDEIAIEPVLFFYIPNAFTPNGNGKNEIFSAVGEEINDFEMQIYNRWGEMIYETKDLNKGWDGSAKGNSNISQEGVYVYNIALTDGRGEKHKLLGHVTLIK